MAHGRREKNVDLTSWADEKLKKAVFLNDDKEGKGNSFEMLGQVPRSGDDMKAVTKERIQVHLVFELPAKIPETMYIALPGAAFHADGTIAYQFDKDDVGRAAQAAGAWGIENPGLGLREAGLEIQDLGLALQLYCVWSPPAWH